jgi:serine/threonine-protein kinase
MAWNQDAFERLRAALADRYHLEEAVGSGGMATVYRAEDLKHHRKVAVKVLNPELAAVIGAERFLREIDTAAKLTHPHILPLHDSGEADGFLFYVMPFVKGESLRALLDRERQLPVEDAVRYAREVADALAHAHEEGIIHRDVKPANVLLEAGHAVLVDFGIAQAVATSKEARLTRTGLSLGTAAYMSPEQATGDRALDARSDQYALACVLYEMLMGEPPFTGATASQVFARQLAAPPPLISPIRPSVDSAVDQAIGRALEKIPADRFPSVREFSEALGRASAATAEHPAPKAPDLAPRRKRSRTFRWLASTLSLAIMVVAGGILFLGSTNDLGFRKRDWILITDFQNNTGEAVFDRSLENALSVGLQQSNHLNVFPQSRIAQTLQRMLREDTGEVDEALGREIARRENIPILVVPSIDRIDLTYILAIRIVDPSSGEDLLSSSAQAEGPNEVLPALDRLARELRRDLGESRFSIVRHGVPLGVATTPSLEALEAWSEADFHWGQRRYEEAFTLFRRAIELDSSFAMAHADLGGALFFQGDRVNGEVHVRKALSLTDRVTERERLWILAEIENWKENFEGAIDAYNIYLTRYPDDLNGWFRLGYALMREGRSAEAVEAFERVAEMDPENAAAFINLATSYNFLNRREEAVEHYLRAFELAPAWLTSGNLNHEFGFNYVELGRFSEAEATFKKMLDGDEDQQALGNRSLALMEMYLGHYDQAREYLRHAVFLHHTVGSDLSEMRNRLYLAVTLFANGSDEEAREELDEVRRLASSASVAPTWLANVGKVLARNGLVQEADEVLQEAIEGSDESIQLDRASVALLRGEVALARGDPEGALPELRTAYALRENAYHLESLALGLFRAGHLDEARDRYVALLDDPDLGWEAQDFWVLSHLDLGQVYEELGDVPNARSAYEALLEIWKDGDPDLVALSVARERLERLGSGS